MTGRTFDEAWSAVGAVAGWMTRSQGRALYEAARDCRAAISGRMGVPCVDPMRDGVEPIVTYLLTTD